MATDEARGYIEEIATEMTLLFDIQMAEAVGRINRVFADRQFLTDVQVRVLLHEEQDVWAKHIYYGRDSFWWLDEERAVPVPYDG
jgi:hypothetical protein